jgi:hypothetical protein
MEQPAVMDSKSHLGGRGRPVSIRAFSGIKRAFVGHILAGDQFAF